MDEFDLAILRVIQKKFPLDVRPYESLGSVLGMPAHEVFRRVSALRRLGVIRRLGPLFSSRHLGFRTSLVAVRVAPDAVENLAELLRRRPEVTHNYLRDGRFNVWFTVLVPAKPRRDDAAKRILGEVRASPGVCEVRTFASRKVFKLDASFAVPGEAPSSASPASLPPRVRDGVRELRGKSEARNSNDQSMTNGGMTNVGSAGFVIGAFDIDSSFGFRHSTLTPHPDPLPQGERGESESIGTSETRIDETARRIIASVEEGFPDSATPYEDVARALGLEVGELLSRLEGMRESGILRATRAVLDQRLLGLEGNVLAAWAVGEERVDEVGRLFSLRPEVSHCVLRECARDWPYNLYTMIHAGTPARARAIVRELAEASGVTEHVALETLKELKKVPPRYF